MPWSHAAVWVVAALSTVGILVRPFRLPEAVWAVGGALCLLVFGLISPRSALGAVGKGTDVYLFLTGMMLLSETARSSGLFDWVAGATVRASAGSPVRLFLLVYCVGVVVTTFLSNDAAAVVLTPAVYAATRKARVKPLPYLFICAFVANAASFVLPISNPANLVMYGAHVPALGAWLGSFGIPAIAAVAVTCLTLLFTQRHLLGTRCESEVDGKPLTTSGWTALGGLLVTAFALLIVSAYDMPLGAPTSALGVMTAGAVLVRDRKSPWSMVKEISWAVLPLVAGLFVLVEALNEIGVVRTLAGMLSSAGESGANLTAALSGVLLAVGSNAVNNLPAGLIAADTLSMAKPPQVVIDAMLIGVDLGPNLSVTGSLATILWLTALRREGEQVSFWAFLKVGLVVMPPALIASIGIRLLAATS